MLKLPNLELLEYKAKQYFFADEENKKLYEAKMQESNYRYFDAAFKVYMFPQLWESTALGFDVNKNGEAMFGGQAMTEAYTTVFFEPYTETYLVFFGDRICYQVKNANETFFEDLKAHNLRSLSKAKKIY